MSVLNHLSSWRTRPLRFFTAAFVLTLLVVGGERGLATLRGHLGGEAWWIWAAGDYSHGEPIAFYAARDFELETLGPAWISIVADETYLLYVNGRRVGADSYRPYAAAGEYEVSDFLQPGWNRILVELRSSRGAGGLLARLRIGGRGADDQPPQAIVTDSDWRIFRRYDRGLFGGWSDLETGEAPQVWGRPPTGRWRVDPARVRRPISSWGFPPPERRRPLRFRQPQSRSWTELTWTHRIPALGPQQLFDWGEEVEGYVSFDLSSDTGEPGLLYFGSEPPNPRTSHPDEIILPVPGRRHWEDAHPRRFRYLLVVGAEPRRRIEVEVLEPSLARALVPPPPRRDGVFGLAPARSYSMVEETVWSRLKRRAQKRSR